jgi:hypothetical protein
MNALRTLLVVLILALGACNNPPQIPPRDFQCLDTSGRITLFVTVNSVTMAALGDGREDWNLATNGWPQHHVTRPDEHCGFVTEPAP